jgi:hypothetical protein
MSVDRLGEAGDRTLERRFASHRWYSENPGPVRKIWDRRPGSLTIGIYASGVFAGEPRASVCCREALDSGDGQRMRQG